MAKKVHNVCCIGAGYVGGPTCAVLAAKNPQIRVYVADLNEARIDAWTSDSLPIYEPGLLEIVQLARDGSEDHEPNLFFTSNVEQAILDADIIFISVNTPTKSIGVGAGRALDLCYVETAARRIAEVSTSDKIVVEKSTVPCGTAQRLRAIFEQLGQPGVHFEVLSNPEFLAEGTATKDLLQPDRVLLGSLRTTDGIAATEALTDLYAAWVPRDRIINVDTASSELAKLAANCMLAQRISSINSLSALCESEGADIGELSNIVGLDERIGPKFLKASVGFGGSCFRKDVLSLVYMAESRHLNEVAAYWKGVIDINDYQKDRFTRRILLALNNTLANKRIAVLGFAYKKNTADTRESAAVTIVGQLMAENAQVRVYDPKTTSSQIQTDMTIEVGSYRVDQCLRVCGDAYEACRGAAAVVILTEWDEFKTDKLPPPPQWQAESSLELNECNLDPASAGPSSGSSAGGSSVSGASTPITALYTPSSSSEESHEPDSISSLVTSRSKRLDWSYIARIVSRPRLVFDGRNVVDPTKLESFGFQVYSIGRGSSTMMI